MAKDLVDLIQEHRFLGSEFLMWLWYKCELFENRFNIGKHEGCEVWFDAQITLEALMVEMEQSRLKGASPTFTPEAKEALRQGKLATQAKLRITHDGQEFGFVFKAPEFQLSGVRLPALMSRQEDEKFFERMYLIEQLESLVLELYAEFLGIRLSDAWPSTFLPALRTWVQDDSTLDPEAYRALRDANPPIPRRERTVQLVAPPADDASGGAAAEPPPAAEAAQPPAPIPPPADPRVAESIEASA